MNLKIFIVSSLIMLVILSGTKVRALESNTIETTYGTVEYSVEGQGRPV